MNDDKTVQDDIDARLKIVETALETLKIVEGDLTNLKESLLRVNEKLATEAMTTQRIRQMFGWY